MGGGRGLYVSDLYPEIDRLLHVRDPADGQYATELIETLLRVGREAGASDLHLQPTEAGLDLSWRVDGVLHPIGRVSPAASPNVVARLKVIADLLTYRTDLPQEGRVRSGGGDVETRVSTFPTLHGERAVVRLFAPGGADLSYLSDLGLDDDVESALRRLLNETSGAILVTGPAGSGKTTTAYACLREVVRGSRGGRSIVSLEDPIETAVAGVAQSQVSPAAGFDLATGLRSLMRQDPEVILVGEMRDPQTAEIAFQAALTGQLVVTTFHAGSATEAIGRLLDMGIEPYVLRSGVLAIVAQRLLRRLCRCARPTSTPSKSAGDDPSRLGLPVDRYAVSVGCDACRGTGFRGRLLVTEILEPGGGDLVRAIRERRDVQTLERCAVAAGMISICVRACEAVEAGRTSPAEVRRVFGARGFSAG
jgi:type II secretory ATPase GspE/PulE/Tfp pilus assembly ATPase PilB-like protein